MIVLRDVRKSFQGEAVLRGVSFSVEKGETVCLIGSSGSGKSTVLRCINGLESYDSGEINVDGTRVAAETFPEIRSQLAMVFQRFNLFPHRTVLENVTEGPIYARRIPPDEARSLAMLVLEKVGLREKSGAYPSQLSGGQQQRVAIARALAMQPQAILFDEPTSALDPELVGEVLQVMRALANDGLTMLVVTHEMSFAREAAHRVLFLDQGTILESGPARSLLSNPQKERTRDFLRRVTHPL